MPRHDASEAEDFSPEMNRQSSADGYAYSRFARADASPHQQSDTRFDHVASIATHRRHLSTQMRQIAAVNFAAANRENNIIKHAKIRASQALTGNDRHPHG